MGPRHTSRAHCGTQPATIAAQGAGLQACAAAYPRGRAAGGWCSAGMRCTAVYWARAPAAPAARPRRPRRPAARPAPARRACAAGLCKRVYVRKGGERVGKQPGPAAPAAAGRLSRPGSCLARLKGPRLPQTKPTAGPPRPAAPATHTLAWWQLAPSFSASWEHALRSSAHSLRGA